MTTQDFLKKLCSIVSLAVATGSFAEPVSTTTELLGTTYYYNAGNQLLRSIPLAWPEAVRTAQRELLLSQQFKPVPAYAKPESQMPFAIVSESFVDMGDHFEQRVRETPLPIALSQNKLLSHPLLAPRLPELMPMLLQSEELKAWWANDMRYLRGSPLATQAMQLFGLSQETLEAIVLECRGKDSVQ